MFTEELGMIIASLEGVDARPKLVSQIYTSDPATGRETMYSYHPARGGGWGGSTCLDFFLVEEAGGQLLVSIQLAHGEVRHCLSLGA